jgi:hypothetical protein
MDYPQVIKRPMDLSTVKRSIDRAEYASFEEVFADL